ncbi:hypothetical protein ACFWIR_38890, partial [Streptomyces olivaceus]
MTAAGEDSAEAGTGTAAPLGRRAFMASAAVVTVTGPLSAGAARAAGPPPGGAPRPSRHRSVA